MDDNETFGSRACASNFFYDMRPQAIRLDFDSKECSGWHEIFCWNMSVWVM